MPINLKISQLTDGTIIQVTDEIPVSRSGANRKVKVGALAALDSLSKADVGLGNVDDTSDANKPISIATQAALNNKLETSLRGAVNGLAELDASGKVPLAQLPAGALPILVMVADQAARFALTIAQVQNGDTVKQVDTNLMYFVVDDTNLNNASGYDSYDATTDWSLITSKPANITEIAAITKVNDDLIQVKGGVYVARTPAQLKTDLALTKGDVGLGNVVNADTTTTSNIADSLNKRFVTDADLITISDALITSDIGVTVQPYNAETTFNDIPQQFTKQHNPQAFELSIINNQISWDLDEAQFATVTISANTVLLPASNPQNGGRYIIIVLARAGAQLTFGGDDFYLFNTGSSPVLQNGVNKFIFDFNGENMISNTPLSGYASLNPIPALAPNSWFNAKAYIGLPSNVSTVNDQGSNNIDGVKIGTGNINIGSINGVDSFNLGAANNNKGFNTGLINVSNLMTSGGMTIIAVIKPNFGSTNIITALQSIFTYSNNFDILRFSFHPITGDVEGVIGQGGNGYTLSGNSPAIAVGKPTVLSWVKNSLSNSFLYENKVQINPNGQTQIVNLVGTATQSGIGFTTGSPYISLSGELGELLIFSSALSSLNRETIEQWLMNKYSII
jgi:hypothetical protein